MNYREGRIGTQEGVSIATIALSTSGLFCIDSSYAYSKGNSTYITLPLSIIVSLLVFLLCWRGMRSSGCRNFAELITFSMGKVVGKIVILIITAVFIVAALEPLSIFIQVMTGLIYDDAEYTTITFFIIPVIFLIAVFGLESIGRIAKCFAILLVVMLLISLASTLGEIEAFRLYPLLGDGIEHMTEFTLSEVFSFLPAMCGLMVAGNGLQGVKNIKKIGIISAVIAIVICLTVQLFIGLIYTYKDLQNTFVPLYRINLHNLLETYHTRMDKLTFMAWLNGCIIACAFYIYSAGLTFSQGFHQRDVRPAILTFTVITTALVFMKFEKITVKTDWIRAFYTKYAYIAIAAPLIIVAVVSIIKAKVKHLSAKEDAA